MQLKLLDVSGSKTIKAKKGWFKNLLGHAKNIDLESEVLKGLCRGLSLHKLLLSSSQFTLTYVDLKDLHGSFPRPIKQLK